MEKKLFDINGAADMKDKNIFYVYLHKVSP